MVKFHSSKCESKKRAKSMSNVALQVSLDSNLVSYPCLRRKCFSNEKEESTWIFAIKSKELAC